MAKYVDSHASIKEFLLDNAKNRNIIINPHWYNIMNYENHNFHLTKKEYKQEVKNWGKFIREWSFNNFIEVKKYGEKQDVTHVVR